MGRVSYSASSGRVMSTTTEPEATSAAKRSSGGSAASIGTPSKVQARPSQSTSRSAPISIGQSERPGEAALTADTPRLSDFAGIPLDLVELHPGWLPDAAIEAFRSMNVDLALWMFSASPEILAAVLRYDPAYVNTGEAELLRRWLGQ